MISYENDIQRLLDIATNRHLNFLNLIFNKEMEPAYPQSSSILKKGLEQLPIVFNYLGEMQEDINMLSTLKAGKEQVGGEKRFSLSLHIQEVVFKFLYSFRMRKIVKISIESSKLQMIRFYPI
ncbi:hypothetical protein ASL14_25435 (plasmid) [Paenibacillus sp. IHB B 3084]|uniref:hypothetical protein n=1 Tax=Paenibacillus sp. IHB B 3084 TaxID=867076 RepID=UPI0007205194|nr:hypothetical protein [Paenibacillus sp. IHB B 3084]ALP39242.1 hypothetical protein ASL14_25435 [Paenibacillus sp. IHB B 3084]